jgi:hypothetical protein
MLLRKEIRPASPFLNLEFRIAEDNVKSRPVQGREVTPTNGWHSLAHCGPAECHFSLHAFEPTLAVRILGVSSLKRVRFYAGLLDFLL